MTPDQINAAFELGGAACFVPDVLKIRRDRQVRGVYWPVRAFFLIWGAWNLFYYPHLEQWWSLSAGMLLTGINVVWVGYAMAYRKN